MHERGESGVSRAHGRGVGKGGEVRGGWLPSAVRLLPRLCLVCVCVCVYMLCMYTYMHLHIYHGGGEADRQRER
jgi:hypothetical protein